LKLYSYAPRSVQPTAKRGINNPAIRLTYTIFSPAEVFIAAGLVFVAEPLAFVVGVDFQVIVVVPAAVRKAVNNDASIYGTTGMPPEYIIVS
jgi:hypothetical protein